jgi:hypothetical protein
MVRSAHSQRSTLSQSLRDPAAEDTIGLHPPPQLEGESVNEFCLPRLRPGRWERHPLSESAPPEVSSIENLMTVKKRSGLSSEKRVRRVPAGKASPKARGRTKAIL